MYLPAPEPSVTRTPPSAPPATPSTAPAWHDRSIFEVMWNARGPIVALALLGFFLGIGVWIVRPSVYEAAASVYVHRPTASSDNNPFRSDGATAAGPSAQEAVMKSHAVLSAVLDQPGIGDGETLGNEGDKLSYLAKKIRVGVADDKETFTVRFRSTDPQEAADVVNAVVNQYIQTQRRRAMLPLGGLLGDDAEAEVSDTTVQATLNAFAVNVASREMMSRLAEQALSRLNEEVIDASLNLEAAENRVAAAEAAAGDADELLQLAMDDTGTFGYDQTAIEQIRRIEIALNTAKTRYRAAQKVLGPQHPVYRTYASDVEVLTGQLRQARESTAENLLDTFAKAKQQAEARFHRLQQRVAATRAAAAQIDQLAIEVLDPATPPRKRASPKLLVHAAAGTLLGLFAGTLLGLIGEVRRVAEAHVRFEEQAGDAAAPGGFLPAPGGVTAAAYGQLGWDRPAPANEPPPLLGTIPRIAATHRLVGPGYDRAADSVHQVRAVLQAIARQQELKSVAFVSPRRGTGRTSVSIGVASSLATAGTRVLAVDGDLSGRLARRQQAAAEERGLTPRRPDANLAGMAESCGHFDPDADADSAGSAAEPANGNGHHQHANGARHESRSDLGPLGIAGYLDGEPLEDCLKPARTDALAFLPANTAEERHLGVFSDRKIADLIDQTRDHFDLILFDSGPVPGSLESLTIASVVDGVVIVLEEGHDVAEYQRTLQHLRVINAKVLGVVVNKADGNDDRFRAAHGSDDAGHEQADAETAAGHTAAGSGILAASVFTDAQSGYREEDWELTAVNDLLPDADLPEVETKPN